MGAHDIDTLRCLAEAPDEGCSWRVIRASMAQDALSDGAWLERFARRQEQASSPLEEMMDGFPVTLPRELGTAQSSSWLEGMRRDYASAPDDFPEPLRSCAQQSRARSGLAVETAQALWQRPGITGLAFGSLALAPRALAAETPLTAALWALAAVAISLAFACLGRLVCRREPRTQLMSFGLAAGAVTALAMPLLGAVIAVVGVGLGLLSSSSRLRRNGILDSGSPVNSSEQASCPVDTNTPVEIDESVVRALRARASLYEVDCLPLSDVDAAAVTVGFHAWMYALRAQSIDQASWFGPASVESMSALIARAAGHGRDDAPLPGLVAPVGAFPGLARRRALWRSWLLSKLGDEGAAEALGRVARDLEGSYSDRVSQVSRYLSS